MTVAALKYLRQKTNQIFEARMNLAARKITASALLHPARRVSGSQPSVIVMRGTQHSEG